MTGWIQNVYSKYHCVAPIGDVNCNKPARLRLFRDDNVPLCDECFRIILASDPHYQPCKKCGTNGDHYCPADVARD